ncbi:peptidase M48 [Eikenella sp. NML96-A-049]|uniref:M48 family metallopeptidase n=1 Tax=unclassified Eikenella TaxID=2639367 RepID=UPI0007DF5D03|nr:MULTISPECIES: M48 family metallopeptidase [unclassified Eikenella]OAM33754.1 peptidase M48 [Eikenella sp. NML070372]OAM41706.1 peptidase M48 [Eikenella sp. NML96-A-049]
MSATVFYLFLGFTAFSTLLQLLLSLRQSRAVLLHRGRVPRDFKDVVSLEEHQKTADYTLAKQRFSRWHILYETLLLLMFTLGGGLNLLAETANRLATSLLNQGVLLVVLFSLVSSLLSLPFALYRSFRLEAAFGFNNMTLGTFFADQIKGLLLGAAIGIPLLYAVIYLMGAAGNAWWLRVWLLWLGFSLLMLWAFPKWIAPLFNRFEPLADEDLQQRITNLLTRTGFASNGIFVMDGSKRSGHANAYFTGLGQNKRIVFFDTLLKGMQPQEVEAVLAHELGHFKHRHIMKQIAVRFLLAILVLFALGQIIHFAAVYHGLGVAYPSHAMALLLMMLVLPVLSFPFAPLGSLSSRRNEFEADHFAAAHTHAEDLISALIKLYRNNAASLVNDRWYARWYDSHPNARERIAALRQGEQAS